VSDERLHDAEVQSTAVGEADSLAAELELAWRIEPQLPSVVRGHGEFSYRVERFLGPSQRVTIAGCREALDETSRHPCRGPEDVGVAVARGIEKAGSVLISQDAVSRSLLDLCPIGNAAHLAHQYKRQVVSNLAVTHRDAVAADDEGWVV